MDIGEIGFTHNGVSSVGPIIDSFGTIPLFQAAVRFFSAAQTTDVLRLYLFVGVAFGFLAPRTPLGKSGFGNGICCENIAKV